MPIPVPRTRSDVVLKPLAAAQDAGTVRGTLTKVARVPILRNRVMRAGIVAVAVASTVTLSATVAATTPTTPSTTGSTTSTTGSTTSTAPSTTPATTTTASTTTTSTSTTTTTAPPVDLLAGMNWLQATLPSPCGDGAIQVIGGTAIAGAERIVLDDVVPLAPIDGLALAFLSCEQAGGTTRTRSAAVVEVAADRAVTTVAEQELPAGRVLAIDGGTFTVESGEGAVPDGACCAPLVRRQTFTATADGFDVVDGGQVSAFEQTIGAESTTAGNAALVRSSVPAAALCYRWGDASMYPQDPPAEPEPPTEPSAELQTIRLALIHVTGRWIAPASEMTPAMGEVVAAYQEARGLVGDGVIGPQTARALAADLGCPETGSFRQIDPPQLGPRRYAGVADLLGATARYGATGQSGNPSLDALLTSASWDGANAMFLGCARRETPAAGVTCSWSGRTPLQLVGLVDDPSVAGIASFSVLYARSAAPG